MSPFLFPISSPTPDILSVLHNFNDLKISAYTMFSWVQIIEMSSSNEPRRLSGLLLSNPQPGPCPHFTGEKTDTCLGLDINPQPTTPKQADTPGPLHPRGCPVRHLFVTTGKSITAQLGPGLGFLIQQVWIGGWESGFLASSQRMQMPLVPGPGSQPCSSALPLMSQFYWLAWLTVIYWEKYVRRWDHHSNPGPASSQLSDLSVKWGWQNLPYTFLRGLKWPKICKGLGVVPHKLLVQCICYYYYVDSHVIISTLQLYIYIYIYI